MIRASDYEFWTHQISRIFKNERSTLYFSTSQKPYNGKIVMRSKGVLFSRVSNSRQKQRFAKKKEELEKIADAAAAALEKGVPGGDVRETLEAPETEAEIQPDAALVAEGFAQLKNYHEVDGDSKHSWDVTFEARRKLLLETSLAIDQYFEQFPVLKHANGYELLVSDFNRLFPNQTRNFNEDWPLVASCIVKIAATRDKLRKELRSLEGATVDLKALYILPFLFDPVNYSTAGALTDLITKPVKQALLRSTRAEMQRTVILSCEIAGSLCTELKRLQNRSYLLGQTVQPLVVAIGDKVCPDEYQVVINGIKYSLPSFHEAFDVCFKSFYALHRAYPRQGERLWQVIQNQVYQIGLTDNFEQVEAVMTEIVNLLGVQA